MYHASYCNVQASLDSPARLYQTARCSISSSAPDDERVIRSKHVEQRKNDGIKIIYMNCASRWSSTHFSLEFSFISVYADV